MHPYSVGFSYYVVSPARTGNEMMYVQAPDPSPFCGRARGLVHETSRSYSHKCNFKRLSVSIIIMGAMDEKYHHTLC